MVFSSKKIRSLLKLVIATIIIIIVLYIFSCIKPFTHASVTRYVQKHQLELNSYVEQVLKDRPIKQGTYNGWKVTYNFGTQQIDFSVGGFGLAPSSTYWGFTIRLMMFQLALTAAMSCYPRMEMVGAEKSQTATISSISKRFATIGTGIRLRSNFCQRRTFL